MVTNQATYNIVVQGSNKTARELFDEIEAEAERRSGAGGVSFTIRAG